METTPEIRFCVKYLLSKGVNALNFDEVAGELRPDDKNFELTPMGTTSFFDDLARHLRELWPSGDKGGKYPWRDSVPNLSKRLSILWKERLCGKQYTLEECLTVARRYLARFEHDTTYMRTLKYFILKQREIVKSNGRITYVNESVFADMLEGKKDEDAILNEWDDIVNSASVGEGELI